MTRLERLTKNPTSLAGAVMLFVHCTMWTQNGHSGQFVQSHTQNGWKMLKDIQNKQNSGKSFGCFSVCFYSFWFCFYHENKTTNPILFVSKKTEVAFWRLVSTPQISRRFEKNQAFFQASHILQWNTLGRKLWAFSNFLSFQTTVLPKKTLQASHKFLFLSQQPMVFYITKRIALHLLDAVDSCAQHGRTPRFQWLFFCGFEIWVPKPALEVEGFEGQWGLSIGSIDLWMYLSVRMQKTWHAILCYHNVHYIYLYMYIFCRVARTV